jgi:butyryl-CoA dehydrogenase
MGILAVSQGLQCLGGYGYCDEFPLEQYYRDVRIHPIHEGTTGIQGMDLLGRKAVMKNGRALALFLAEIEQTAAAARAIPDCAVQAQALADAAQTLTEVTTSLTGLALKGEIEVFLADAALYLEMFGIIAIAWQWLLQAIAATRALAANPAAADVDFYLGKVHTCRYFFAYELPKIRGLAERLKGSGDGLTVRMKPEWFE